MKQVVKMRIKEIANLAGVSPATVSRVMNNSGYVKEEKRKAVLKVIEEVGYQPNEIAKSLKNQKSRMIGVIVPKISTETASRVVSGVTEIAKANKYQIVIANTNLDIEEEINYLKFLSNKSVDGIIMMATELTDRHIDIIKQLTIPIILLGQSHPEFTSIIHDDYQATYDLTIHLIEQGHQAISFLGVNEKDVQVGKVRKQGFIDAMKASGLTVDPDLLLIGDFEIETANKQVATLLKTKRPTAILAVTDHLAIGAIHGCLDQGLNVPGDVSVVGIGDIGLAKYLNPPLTTVHYMFKTSGKMACEALFKQMEDPESKREHIITAYQLEKRKSVRKLD